MELSSVQLTECGMEHSVKFLTFRNFLTELDAGVLWKCVFLISLNSSPHNMIKKLFIDLVIFGMDIYHAVDTFTAV